LSADVAFSGRTEVTDLRIVAPDSVAESPSAGSANAPPLRIEESPQRLIVLIAERGPDPHVSGDRARDPRRKSFRRIVTTRTVLLEHLLPAIAARSLNRFRSRLVAGLPLHSAC
jgi:hypothetical protein